MTIVRDEIFARDLMDIQVENMNEQIFVNQIRRDYLDGMTYKDIAEKYYIDQRTAKRYVEKNLPLSELEHRTFASILDPYEPYLRSVLSTGPVFAKAVYKELREAGYEGSYSLVNRRVQQIIRENEAAGIYEPECPRTRNIAKIRKSLTLRMEEETEYASHSTE